MFLKKSDLHRGRLGMKLSVYALAAIGVYAIGATAHSKCAAMMEGCKCMMQKIKKAPAEPKTYSECAQA